MTNVFVWTLHDVVGLALFILVVFIGGGGLILAWIFKKWHKIFGKIDEEE